MNLEVVGRHALLFDDDAMANFVNSADALVDWNSLAIDRYDVRHLLSGPPPPRRRRSPLSAESDLDYERYLDLPSPSDEQLSHQPDPSISLPDDRAGGLHTVGYSYDDSSKSIDHNGMNAESEASQFSPSFPVPENLIQNLPPTEKVHQIIARTAKFVSEHGGQTEVVLRVKQGNNPTFGFLMPDHHLHAYFRFLVDHQELLSANNSNQEANNDTLKQNKSRTEGNGALSLLCSLYGTGEDEEMAQESAKKGKEKAPEVTGALERRASQGAGKDLVLDVHAEKDLSNNFSKEKAPSKKSVNLEAGTAGISKSVKKASEGPSKHLGLRSMKKPQASDMLEMPKPEAIILEPPSDMKKLIDKIVEFVQRNGKEVETVLREQDVKHGRFPFLVSSNLYHPYYQKILQKTRESSTTEKGAPKKDNSVRHRKETSGLRESDVLSTGSAELPFDANKKEKFTMVLGKSKGLVQASKASEAPSEVGMDTMAIAAILQAATRGAKFPNLKFLSKTSINGSGQNVDEQASSTNVSCPQNSAQKQDLELRNPSVPVAKYIAKTAALAAASEADSLEASMTKEQKLKAERLKRAKMFAAMIKGGGASIKSELLRGNSADPPESGASGLVRGLSVDRPDYVERSESGASVLVGEVGVQGGREREDSSIPPNVKTSKETEKFEMKGYDNEDRERRSKRSYRSKSKKNVGYDDEVSAYRKSRQKHRSHGSDEKSAGDEDGHEKAEGHSRKKHRSHRYDDKNVDVDENGGKAHSRKKHRSHRSSHDDSKGRRRHGVEHHSQRDRHRRHSSSDDEHHHNKSSSKRARNFETRENSTGLTDQTKADPSSPKETTAADIPAELRAKVRAMLLANL